jgi:hypothetical protein
MVMTPVHEGSRINPMKRESRYCFAESQPAKAIPESAGFPDHKFIGVKREANA